MRAEKTVVFFDENQYDGEWPPENAIECVEWFAEKLTSIPAEYRNTAMIEIGSNSSYDSDYGHIMISFTRPETDEEMAEREGRESRRKRAEEEYERMQLMALKAKYGQ